MQGHVARFCEACGGPLEYGTPAFETRQRPVCRQCGRVAYKGPAVLVMVSVIAAHEQMLLIRRGTHPYVDKWAPPGGFVEMGESLETAAIRELREEAGLELTPEQLRPHLILSVPEINQVYVAFAAFIEAPVPLHASPPESLDARWFSESDFPKHEIWDPAHAVDIAEFFRCARRGRFDSPLQR